MSHYSKQGAVETDNLLILSREHATPILRPSDLILNGNLSSYIIISINP